MKVTLGAQEFGTKAAARLYVKSILNNSPFNTPLVDQEKEAILSLIKMHPEAARKIGCGIKEIIIKFNDYWKKGFYIIRVDGSTTDFSYIACFNAPTLHNEISKACRSAVRNDIKKFKDDYFNSVAMICCPITGEILTKNNSDVDHINPKFRDIVSRWERTQNITKFDINETADNDCSTWFVKKELAEDFRKFHNDIATLRIVSEEANRRILR